jgi:hypothetical protein
VLRPPGAFQKMRPMGACRKPSTGWFLLKRPADAVGLFTQTIHWTLWANGAQWTRQWLCPLDAVCLERPVDAFMKGSIAGVVFQFQPHRPHKGSEVKYSCRNADMGGRTFDLAPKMRVPHLFFYTCSNNKYRYICLIYYTVGGKRK